MFCRLVKMPGKTKPRQNEGKQETTHSGREVGDGRNRHAASRDLEAINRDGKKHVEGCIPGVKMQKLVEGKV